VIAADTGSAITGMHVDWFVGRRENYAALDDIFGLTTVTIHAAGDRRP
jgi:3D (Asp-Asp-Asp) domain-containing protein